MSVYDRSMFRRGPSMSRGPRLSPQDMQKSAQMVEQVAAPMIQQGMAGIAQDMQRGIKQAKNYEEAINAFRGDVKPMKARKDELGTIVGPKDAKKTPDSVVALAQPAIQMKVMQGIGSMPQAPVKMQAGGVATAKPYFPTGFGFAGTGAPRSAGMPTLMDLYNRDSNRQLLEQIYPDTSEAARKSALGSLLLGAVAPAALRFASGTPLTEAIEPLPAAFAQAGLQAQQGKQAREQAIREGRFKLASDELANIRAVEAARAKRESEVVSIPEGGVLAQKTTGKIIAEGPKKKRKKVNAYRTNPNDPSLTGFETITIFEGDEVPAGFTLGNAPTAVPKQYKDNVTGDLVQKNPYYVASRNDARFTEVPKGSTATANVIDKASGNTVPILVSEFDPQKHQLIQQMVPIFRVDKSSPTGIKEERVTEAQLQTDKVEGDFTLVKPGGTDQFSEKFDNTLNKVVKVSAYRETLDPGRFTTPVSNAPTDVFRVSDGEPERIPYDEYLNNKDMYTLADPGSLSDVEKLDKALMPAMVAKENVLIGDKTIKKGEPIPSMTRAEYDALDQEVKESLVETAAFTATKPADDPLITVTPLISGKAGDFRVEEGVETKIPQSVYVANAAMFGERPEDPLVTVTAIRSGNFEGIKFVKDQTRQIPRSVYEKHINAFVSKTSNKPAKLTESSARTEIRPLSQQINDATTAISQDTIDQFESLLGAIANKSGTTSIQISTEDGIQTQPPSIPNFAMRALKKIREQQEAANVLPENQINDYGLLTEAVEASEPEILSLVRETTQFDDSTLGVTGAFKRALDNVAIPLQNLVLGRSSPAFPASSEAIKTVQALNQYSTGVFIAAVGRQNANLIATFENTLPDIGSITQSPSQIAKQADRVADKLSNQKNLLEAERNELPAGASQAGKRAKLRRQMIELEFLSDDYRRLANLLKASSRSGDTSADETQYENIFSFGTRD